MASSTNRPSAIISDPSEMRCSSILKKYMARKVIASTSGIDSATTMPVRQPRLTKLTPSTITTASSSDCINSLTELFTTRGWSDTGSILTPTGSSVLTWAISAFSVSPSLITSPPFFMLMARPSAGLPLKRMAKLGGVA